MRNMYMKVVLLMLLLVVSVACGSAEASAPAASEEAAVEESSAEEVSAAEGSDRDDWPEEFVIGVFAGDDAEAALEGNEPLQEYLEAKLGIPVTAQTGTSYSAVIEAMRAGRVDAMQVGPFSFVLAEREAGAIPIATTVNESRDVTEFDADLFPYYFSVFVTQKGSGVESLEDLEGVDFAFVDPASTSGRNAPVVRLINEIDGLENTRRC